MIRILLINFLIVIFNNTYSININYNIPDSLLINSDAIIINDSTTLDIYNKGYTIKNYQLVKLMNANLAESFSVWLYNSENNNSTLIKGNIYDASGRLIKKIKNKDFTALGDLSNFSSDVSYDFYIINETQYPIYVELEIENKSNVLFVFPNWMPLSNYNCALLNASLHVNTSDSSSFRCMALNQMSQPIKKILNNNYTYKWSLNYIKPYKKEEMAPKVNQIYPTLLLAPTKIVYNKYTSNFYTWQDLGNWIKQLNLDRDILPDDLKKELHALTDTIPSIYDKAKAIYYFMQKHTRYVSIQYGIGGFQPFDASYVYNKGYGDCKALSNYMYALLKEVGIKAYYTLVKAGDNNDIIKEFPSSQFNHAILCLPIDGDTIWLENTAQNIPFGFNGDFTGDRDVLVIADTPYVTHTNIYALQDNLFKVNGKAILENNNSYNSEFNILFKGDSYSMINEVCNISDEELKKNYLKKIIGLTDATLTIDSVHIDESMIPSYQLYLASTFFNKNKTTSARIFIPAILFGQVSNNIERKKRVLPVFENRNYTDIYSFIIELPEGYEFELHNEMNEVYENKIGSYRISIKVKDIHHVLVERTIQINKALYKSTELDDYFKFYDTIKALENSFLEVKVHK